MGGGVTSPFSDTLSTMDWPGWITAIATAVIAWTAWRALNTWKAQSKAQKQTDFLDQLTDSVHEFLSAISPAIEMVGMVKIGIESHSRPEWTEHQATVAYINASGAQDGELLLQYLKPCSHLISKVRSLVTKGQVFGFKDYANCRNACEMILWHHDRIQALYSMIAPRSLNWENQYVQEVLAKVTKVDAAQMKETLSEAHTTLLTFVKDNYASILA